MSWTSHVASVRNLMKCLNTATREEMILLPSLGSSKVDQILQIRDSLHKSGRPFSLKDFMNIPRVGPSLLIKLTGGATGAPQVAKYITFYEDRFTGNSESCVLHPRTVLSVDLGVVHSAFSLVDETCTVRQWGKLDLGLPKPYSPGECYRKVKESLHSLPLAEVYILEEQSHRTPTNRGFLGISMQLRTLEAIVYAVLSQRPNTFVQSILPKRVSSYFTIEANKSMKKKSTIKLVQELIDKNSDRTTPMGCKVNISEDLVEYFNAEKKKDDLSDCLLFSLAVLDWSLMVKETNCTN